MTIAALLRRIPSTLLLPILFSWPCLRSHAAGDALGLFVAPQTLRSSELMLLWHKPEGASKGMEYRILLDGKPFGGSARTHFSAKGLAPRSEYRFQVVAVSATGEEIARSGAVDVSTPEKEPIVSVERFGAVGDGATINTRAIQAAIDACPKGGVVLIPEGVFVSGALFLKSDMTLEVAARGVLKGSGRVEDYEPLMLNRFEGWELKTCSSLLNAGVLDRNGTIGVRNLSIRGEGTISGGGGALGKAMTAAHGLRGRGRLICLMNCANVELQGLTLEEPPSWTLHYIYSENITCRDLNINTSVRNGDGMDPDSSKNVFIVNCAFDTGDDCIAIKSGKNPEGNVINRPTENVWIVDCRFARGHGISIGSEMSGGVRDVLVLDCSAGRLLHGLQIKGTRERGGFVERVTVRDCDLQKISILSALPYNNDGEAAPEAPLFRDFVFENIDMTKADPKQAMVLNGFSIPGHRAKNLRFENIALPEGAVVRIDEAEDLVFSKVLTIEGRKPSFDVKNSANISY